MIGMKIDGGNQFPHNIFFGNYYLQNMDIIFVFWNKI